MKHLVSPFLLILILAGISFGWSATAPVPVPPDTSSMTLAGDRLFIAGHHTGLHVYDVADPSQPVKLATIPLEFSGGAAVKDDALYASDWGQLVVMDMSDGEYKVVARIGVKYHDGGYVDDESFSCACSTIDYDERPLAPGTSSSFATFAVVDNQLYRVDQSDLVVYDITTPTRPKEVSRINVGWDIETIHPTQNLLFIGGRQGMYIFDREDPARPKQIAHLEHVRACDPVVVSGSTAFVTLRGGNWCGGTANELLCVSIKDPSNPVVVGQKALASPHGLAVQDSWLYVSHGYDGYSLLDVSLPQEAVVEKTWPDEPTRDFIWSDHTLFVLDNRHGVRIYDVSNRMAPALLATLNPRGSQ